MITNNSMAVSLTVGQLRAMIREELIEAMAEAMNEKRSTSQAMSIDEAVDFLNRNGIKISKSTVYKLTSDGTIPFRRFGERKLIFDREELEQWAEDRIK